jgi:hypothetical protein
MGLIMKKTLLLLSTALLLMTTSLSSLSEQATGELLDVKTKTFDGEKFNFPEDLNGEPVSVLFLAISETKESGERQQQELLAWQTAIDESGGLPEGILAYHFPVLQDSFFLPSGIIRNAMAKSYEEKVPLNQAGVLFVKDLEKFVNSAGIALDDQATVITVDANGRVLAQIKGTYSETQLNTLRGSLSISK